MLPSLVQQCIYITQIICSEFWKGSICSVHFRKLISLFANVHSCSPNSFITSICNCGSHCNSDIWQQHQSDTDHADNSRHEVSCQADRSFQWQSQWTLISMEMILSTKWLLLFICFGQQMGVMIYSAWHLFRTLIISGFTYWVFLPATIGGFVEASFTIPFFHSDCFLLWITCSVANYNNIIGSS